MCGIVGLVGSFKRGLINELNDSQFHRGPDDFGVFYDEESCLQLGMRRLSIVDIGSGHQPMSNEDDSIWIVFNGEIFNANELRSELVNNGHIFKTINSDTEVLIHLYEDLGTDMLSKLNGMFAFCIYDKSKNLIFCARDQFGIKPFFYQFNDKGLAFASELKSLLCLSDDFSINRLAIKSFLSTRYSTSKSTIYNEVSRLDSGNFFVYHINSKSFQLHKYFDVNLILNNYSNKNVQYFSDGIRELLFDAVKRWSISEVEVTSSLSGGIDSGIITSIMAIQNDYRVKTYTLGFEHDLINPYSDFNLAKTISNKYNTDHHEIVVTEKEFLDNLIEMVWVLDEPYGGGLPSWFIYKEASKYSKVILTGSGGDELFGNYGKWQLFEDHFVKSRSINTIRKYIKKSLSNFPELFIGGNRKKRWSLNFSTNNDQMFYPFYFNDDEVNSLILNCNNSPLASDYFFGIQNNSNLSNIRDRFTSLDLQTQLPDEFMMMTDRFSMISSIEARTPFLDKEFVEFVLRIPSHLRTKRDNLKYLLKDSFSDLLSDEVLGGKKSGFEIPVSFWLRNYLRKAADFLFSEQYIKDQNIFNFDHVSFIKNKFYSKRYGDESELWILFSFQLWYHVHVKLQIKTRPNFGLNDLF
jgi:asparagine synthase (glutamine-hydrolysing)